MTPDLDRIIAGLSEAQRAKLLEIPLQRPFKPKFYGQWPSLSVLKAKRLINGVRDGIAGMGKDAEHVITLRGLAVRQRLQEMNDDK